MLQGKSSSGITLQSDYKRKSKAPATFPIPPISLSASTVYVALIKYLVFTFVLLLVLSSPTVHSSISNVPPVKVRYLKINHSIIVYEDLLSAIIFILWKWSHHCNYEQSRPFASRNYCIGLSCLASGMIRKTIRLRFKSYIIAYTPPPKTRIKGKQRPPSTPLNSQIVNQII